MKIIQHTPTVTSYDAIGFNILSIYRLLKRNNFATEIYADNFSQEFRGLVKNSRKLTVKKDDILILHFSIGSLFYDNIDAYKCKKCLIYHNITPPEFFLGYSAPGFTSSLLGLRQLKAMLPSIDFSFADSDFNSTELRKLGYKDTVVMPFYYDIDSRFGNISLERGKLISHKDKVNILFVGRITPNKKQDDLVKAFYYYNKYFNKNSVLNLVGSYDGMESYKNKILEYISALGLEKKVYLRGRVTDKELVGYYKKADIFVSMSEHEGYCVPIVEAMKFNIPILAYYYSGAVPETAGKGAIFFTKKDSFSIAGAIDYVVKNKDLQRQLFRNQRMELGRFEKKVLEDGIMSHINNIIVKSE